MRETVLIAGAEMDRVHAMRHGAAILFLLRERIAYDWDSLCASLELSETSLFYLLHSTLEALEEAGLVTIEERTTPIEERTAPINFGIGAIKLVSNWEKIQTALGISLAELARYDRDRSLVVTPWFGSAAPRASSLDVFVLMPFGPALRPVYEDHIMSVAKSLDLKVGRADDFFRSGAVIEDVWTAINAAKILVADCTGRNPNVFYEVGIAHTIGKRVILITQSRDDVPFDIQHLRYIHYEFTPRGMKDFELNLKEALTQELVIPNLDRGAVVRG